MANNFDNFPHIGGLMVSKMVVDEKIPPRFMYREKPTRAEDSGWRIFTGMESEDYSDDPTNAGIYNPSTILNIDPSIANLLLTGIGSVYEKNEDDQWYKVDDYDLDDDFIETHRLTDNWSMDINNLFLRRVEDSGDLMYTTGDKTVRLAIWQEDKTREALAAEHQQVIDQRDQTNSPTLKTFDISDDEVIRMGYCIRESDGDKNYSAIYGFCLIDGEVLQAAFYFDDVEDLPWAMETWQSIRVA